MDIIVYWFTENKVTFLNILSVCIFIENRRLSDSYDVSSMYKNITDVLLDDRKIQIDEYRKLNSDFLEYLESGLVDDYVLMLQKFKDNPNIITPGKWVPTKNRDHLQNRCVPCRSKSQIMHPF